MVIRSNCHTMSMHTLKPLDTEAVLAAAQETSAIMTIEEHSIIGGLGSAAAEVLAELGNSHIAFKRLGIKDAFCLEVGDQKYLHKVNGLSPENIAETVLHSLSSNPNTLGRL